MNPQWGMLIRAISQLRREIMPDQLGHSRSNLRRVTRTLELRNRLRRASTVIETIESRTADPGDRSLWGTYKHYVWAIGGVLVGGMSVLIGTVLLDGSRTASPGELAKMTSPMIVAVDRALAQADQLVKILETIVDKRRSKAHSEEPAGKGEYQDCLENCAKGVRVDDESDKWLLMDCRNECISRFSKRVKEIRELYTD
jgi:hypothetical protein